MTERGRCDWRSEPLAETRGHSPAAVSLIYPCSQEPKTLIQPCSQAGGEPDPALFPGLREPDQALFFGRSDLPPPAADPLNRRRVWSSWYWS